MKTMLKITGNTYPHRRALRAFGAIFSHVDVAYFGADSSELKGLSETLGLDVKLMAHDASKIMPATGEALRAIRQAKIDRRKKRLYDCAARARTRAAKHNISQHERDFLALGEPVKVGHHSERRHRNLIEKAQSKATKQAEEHRYAGDLERRADWMGRAVIKGDADRRREIQRAAFDDLFKVGDYAFSHLWGNCEILKVNRKSVRVRRRATGTVMTEDKAMFELRRVDVSLLMERVG